MQQFIILLLARPALPELIVIGIVLLLMFGGKRPAEVMEEAGKCEAESDKIKNGISNEVNKVRE